MEANNDCALGGISGGAGSGGGSSSSRSNYKKMKKVLIRIWRKCLMFTFYKT